MAIQKVKDFLTLVQSANTTYQGDESDQVYSLIPSFLESGETITIIDQGGSNRIELAEGLTITSSILVHNEALLYLSNGSVVNIRGADSFTFSVGANAAAGISGSDKAFSAFAIDVLGQSLPAEGEAAVTINNQSTISSGGGVDIVEGTGLVTVTPDVGTATATATGGPDAITFSDLTTGNFNVVNFNIAQDKLVLSGLTGASGSTLADLSGDTAAMGLISVQVNEITNTLFVNLGQDADDNVISIEIAGVVDASLVNVELI
ncbi:hypothetical protein [Oceanospirillum beijerinckii]|uniref:hypothetical protein n=1 Tax=Oceanospirillum beijerinckii TaxID=64976 RepID=UPI0003F61F77|nr:hypothetical protein [Oceanospirillum beijerinckii]